MFWLKLVDFDDPPDTRPTDPRSSDGIQGESSNYPCTPSQSQRRPNKAHFQLIPEQTIETTDTVLSENVLSVASQKSDPKGEDQPTLVHRKLRRQKERDRKRIQNGKLTPD